MIDIYCYKHLAPLLYELTRLYMCSHLFPSSMERVLCDWVCLCEQCSCALLLYSGHHSSDFKKSSLILYLNILLHWYKYYCIYITISMQIFYEILVVNNKRWFKINILLTHDMQFDMQWNNFSTKSFSWWWPYMAKTHCSEIWHMLKTEIKAALKW